MAVTVKNTGQAALTVSGASVTDTTDFTLKNNCTGAVPAGGTCTLQITFAPAAPVTGAQCGSTTGAKSATLTLTDNATDSPQSVMLNGTATDFCPDPPTVGGTSQTVPAGTTAVFNLDITSMDGFAGTVGLACTGAVPGAGSCTTSPSTVNVPKNGQAPFVANIPTGSSLVRPKARDFKSPPWNRYPMVIALLSLLGLASLSRRAVQLSASLRENQRPRTASRLYRQRMTRAVQPCSLLLMLALAMSACGSGGGGSSVTQPNTYSFTVTATAGGTTRTIALTLTVQ